MRHDVLASGVEATVIVRAIADLPDSTGAPWANGTAFDDAALFLGQSTPYPGVLAGLQRMAQTGVEDRAVPAHWLGDPAVGVASDRYCRIDNESEPPMRNCARICRGGGRSRVRASSMMNAGRRLLALKSRVRRMVEIMDEETGHASSMPIGWTAVCELSEIPVDGALHKELGETEICLVDSGGRIYALRDECSHGHVRLSEGEVCAGLIECYLHGSEFDLIAGVPLTPPVTEPVPVYEMRVNDDIVEISLSL